MATVFISGGRRYIYDPGTQKNLRYADVLWDKLHPEDRRKPGEVVHHKDENSLNDDPSNYKKMTRSDHMKFHAHGRKNGFFGKSHTEEAKQKMRMKRTAQDGTGENSPFYGRKHTEETKQKMRARAVAVGRKPPSQKGNARLGWDIEEAINMRNKGKTWKAIGRFSGVSAEAVQMAFQRRGLCPNRNRIVSVNRDLLNQDQ